MVLNLVKIPELKDAIKKYVTTKESPHPLIVELDHLFSHPPDHLPQVITQLRAYDPQFAERDDQTQAFRQQDASECMGKILELLRREIGDDVKNLFSISLEETLTEPTHKTEVIEEVDDRLRCSIDQNVSQLEQGILNPTTVQRKLEGDDHEFDWNQETKISHLPKYLIIQMLRFTYRTDEQTTAKIVRRVKAPFTLDTLSWLSGDARKAAVEAREAEKTEGTGRYKLKAILTHRGRSADSGHYISHVLLNDTWIRYDDDKVKEVDIDDIENLSGSADWHCSFVLLYEAV